MGKKTAPVGYLKGRGLTGEIARDFGPRLRGAGLGQYRQTIRHDDAKQRLLFDAGLLVERNADKAGKHG